MTNDMNQNSNPKPKMTKTGLVIRVLNALAVGSLAAFSLDKVLIIAGIISAGTLPLGWPLVLMILCGAGIAVITYAMYKKDSWVAMLGYFAKIWRALKQLKHSAAIVISRLTKRNAISEINSNNSNKPHDVRNAPGPLSVDLYGHIGGLIKFVMAFAGVWLLALGSPAFLYLIPLMILVGSAQYFVESTELIPHSQALFTYKPHEKASPTHGVRNTIFTGFKWSMVLGHAFGQGLGVFACMAIVGTMTPVGVPVALAIGIIAMLFIGPSTGRFYGERFFRWGAAVSVDANDQGYSLADIEAALVKKKAISETTDLNPVLTILFTNVQSVDGADITLSEDQTKKLLRYYGYYLNEQADFEKKGVHWGELSWGQKALYWTGGLVGCFGAAFKGALAFAGTVVFCLLITAGTLAVTTTPAGWIIGVSMVIGITTWMVQCARACPNTANGFLSWGLRSSSLGAFESSNKQPAIASEGMVSTTDESYNCRARKIKQRSEKSEFCQNNPEVQFRNADILCTKVIDESMSTKF